MSPGLRAKALLGTGLVLCSTVLFERMLDLHRSISELKKTVIAMGSSFNFNQPTAANSPAARRIVELESDDLFGRPSPEPTPQIQLAKAPEIPPTPTFPYRYFGRVQAQHFLEREGQLVPIEAGTALSDGFEILTVDERQILARHKPTGMAVTISLPTLQE